GLGQELQKLPDDTEIQRVNCGKVHDSHKMKSVGPLSAAGKSPYLKLEVPGLKLKGTAPVISKDLSFDHSLASNLFVAGYLRRSDGIFYRRGERLETAIDNNDRLVFRARQLPKWSTVGDDDDDVDRFDLDIPFGPGLVGSPVFTNDGNLLGLL